MWPGRRVATEQKKHKPQLSWLLWLSYRGVPKCLAGLGAVRGLSPRLSPSYAGLGTYAGAVVTPLAPLASLASSVVNFEFSGATYLLVRVGGSPNADE